MAQMATDIREEPGVSEQEYDDLLRLTGLVRVALGRLGGRISPWLDEGLLMGQGLMALIELAGNAGEVEVGDDDAVEVGDDDAVGLVVAGMRAWARASSWYHAALPCRIAPLCASLAARSGRSAAPDREIAQDLGLDEAALAERYTEAGLVFGVSPELLLPEREGVAAAGGLAGAIARLPVEQRRLLTLYFEDGLSFPEIASLLGVGAEGVQESYGRAATLIRARVLAAGGRLGLGVHR